MVECQAAKSWHTATNYSNEIEVKMDYEFQAVTVLGGLDTQKDNTQNG